MRADHDEIEIIEWCRANMAGYKYPRLVEFRETLPMTATGKILKRELRKPFWENQTRRVS